MHFCISLDRTRSTINSWRYTKWRLPSNLSSMACPVPQYFFYINSLPASHSKKSFWEQNMFWYCLCALSEIFLIPRRTERYIIKTVYWFSCKVFVNLDRLWWNSNFLNRFSRNFKISNFMKIREIGAEMFHADGRTDWHDEADSHFSQFCEGA